MTYNRNLVTHSHVLLPSQRPVVLRVAHRVIMEPDFVLASLAANFCCHSCKCSYPTLMLAGSTTVDIGSPYSLKATKMVP